MHQLTLATRYKGEASFSIPLEFHGWVRERLSPTDQKEMARQAFSTIANAVVAVRKMQTKVVYRRSFERQCLPHIDASFKWPKPVVSKIYEEPSGFLSANDWGILGSVCEHQGHYEQAEQFCRLAIGTTRLELRQHSEVTDTLLSFGLICEKLGKYDEAKKHYFKMLNGSDVGLDEELRVRVWLGLAKIMSYQKKHKDAEKYLKDALHSRERLLGPTDSQTIEVINVLASDCQEGGDTEAAELLRRRELLSWRERAGPGQHITMSISVEQSTKYQEQGRYTEATTLLEETSEALDKRLGPDHLDALKMTCRLAHVYDLSGRFDEAQRLYTRVRTKREQLLGETHPQTLEVYESNALSCKMAGDYKTAEMLCRTALTRNEIVHGRYHKRTLRVLNSLADVCKAQQNYDDAEKLIKDWYAKSSEKRRR
jgi:tetratricopeptide (TPR) repeat protein